MMSNTIEIEIRGAYVDFPPFLFDLEASVKSCNGAMIETQSK